MELPSAPFFQPLQKQFLLLQTINQLRFNKLLICWFLQKDLENWVFLGFSEIFGDLPLPCSCTRDSKLLHFWTLKAGKFKSIIYLVLVPLTEYFCRYFGKRLWNTKRSPCFCSASWCKGKKKTQKLFFVHFPCWEKICQSAFIGRKFKNWCHFGLTKVRVTFLTSKYGAYLFFEACMSSLDDASSFWKNSFPF